MSGRRTQTSTLYWQKGEAMSKRPLCLLCMLVLLADLLFLLCVEGETSSSTLYTAEVEKRKQDVCTVEGKVCQKSSTSEYQILSIKLIQTSIYPTSYPASNTFSSKTVLLVYDEAFTDAAIGTKVRVTGERKEFAEAANPGNFHQKNYYRRRRTAYAVWAKEVTVTDRRTGMFDRVKERLYGIRSRAGTVLVRALGEKDGAVMAAVLLGDKSELDGEIKELYAKSGISHILAISGLHLSFLGAGVYGLLRRAGLGYPAAGALAGGALALYALMTGMSVSTVRALVMFLVKLGADISGRVYDLPTALAFAAALLVLENPYSLCEPAFLLSFGAILGIAMVSPMLAELTGIRGRAGKAFLAGAGVTAVLYPILLYVYYEFPLYSFFSNLVVIPLAGGLLGAGCVGLLVAVCGLPAGMTLLKVCKAVLCLYEHLCEWTLALPFARVVTGQPGKWKIILYEGGLLALVWIWSLWRRRGQETEAERRRASGNLAHGGRTAQSREGARLRAISALAGAALVLLVSVRPPDGRLHVSVLDVGQGDCIVVRTASGKTMLVDGGSSDVKQAGRYRIEPFLESQGIARIDYVFVTHGDADHIGAITEMMERQLFGVTIKCLVLPGQEVWDDALAELAACAARRKIPVCVMKGGEVLRDRETAWTCLGPGEDFAGKPGNESSMILRLDYGNFRMLFCGDVEGEGEKALLRMPELGKTTVLKVSHHGSKNASSKEFLERTSPDYAVISAGAHNSYGHPHRETLERLKSCGAKVYSTQENGAVLIETDGRTVRFEKGAPDRR